MNENEIRLKADNKRLIEENIRLIEEYNFFKDMLIRLIPTPINEDLKTLDYRLKELERRISKIEKKESRTNT